MHLFATPWAPRLWGTVEILDWRCFLLLVLMKNVFDMMLLRVAYFLHGQWSQNSHLLDLFFMNWCKMSIQGSLTGKSIVTDFTFERLISSMNCWNMIFQDSLSRKSVVTNFTFEWLISSMNCWNMVFQDSIPRDFVVTKFTFEWLYAFMNWWNMLVQVTLFGTSVVTNFTYEWLFSIMN